MQTTIRYFASVREAIGTASEIVELPETVSTLGEARAWLAQRSERHAQALGPQRVLRMACDHVMTPADARLEPGRELAFFPPVTGG
ncbi:MAG: molybdopterin converting factor subunit 1 [Betaproteobacteria bacterium]|nr:molybdopterin converting factor subunit 1 [Betaproteobacteria bacterium]